MKLEDLLKQLGEDMGMGEIKLDAKKGCSLVMDGRLRVFIESAPDEKSFFVYAVMGPIPADNEARLALYDVLMEAHLFGLLSGGATFGSSPRFGGVVLSRSFDPNHVTYEMFYHSLEKFINAYEMWTNRLGAKNKASEEAKAE